MTSPNIIEFSIKNVLWNTRGKSWDYLYLNSPDIGVSWYKFISNIEYTPKKYILGKVLFLDNKEIFFVCCQFKEPEFKDRVDRPILHTFVIFIEESQLPLLSNDLDEQLYQSLKTTYTNIYNDSEQYINSESMLNDFIEESINNIKYNIIIIQSNNKISLDKNNISIVIKSNIKKPIENIITPPSPPPQENFVKQGVMMLFFIIGIALMCSLSFVLGCFYSSPAIKFIFQFVSK